jgi:hypothetical protein
VDITSYAAARKDFDTILSLDSAEELSMNFDFTDFDVGMHDSVFADNEIIVGGDGALEVAVNAKGTGKFEFTGHIRTFV